MTTTADVLAVAVLRLDLHVMSGEPLAPDEDVDALIEELALVEGDGVEAWHAYWLEVDLRGAQR